VCALPATHFCLCTYPLPTFCTSCLTAHCNVPGHLLFPVDQITQITAKPEFTRIQSRLACIEAASAAAQSNFPILSQYKSDLESAFAAAIAYLQSLQVQELAELARLEADLRLYIDSTLEELKQHVLEWDYKPKAGLATIAWAFRVGGEAEAVQFFACRAGGISEKRLRDGLGASYEIGIVGFPEKSTDVEERRPMEESASMLMFVFEDFLLGYDWRAGRWMQEVELSRAVAAYANSAVTELVDGSVLCTGGGLEGEEQSRAYQLERNGTVIVLGAMKQARSFHGQVLHNTTVYIFGGRCHARSLAHSEKLPLLPFSSLSSRSWQPLPSLCYPREGCSPCLLSSSIYLCGGATDSSEVFDIAKERFALLPFRLPDANSPCLTVAIAEHLYMISHSDLTTWKVGSGAEVDSMKHAAWGTWGNMGPVVEGGKVRVASLMVGGVVEMDLRAMEMRVIAFSEDN